MSLSDRRSPRWPHQEVIVTQETLGKLLLLTARVSAGPMSYGDTIAQAMRICPKLKKYTINDLKVEE